MTLEELIARANQRLNDLLTDRQTRTDTLAQLRADLDAPDTTVTEQQVSDAITARDGLDPDIAAARQRLDDLSAELARDNAAADLARRYTPVRQSASVTVGAEPRTYTPESDRGGSLFLLDVSRAFLGDQTARGRLDRHMAEERVERGEHLQRAVTSAGFAGLVVPQYLTDLVAPATAAMRPFANICNSHPLPADGMTVNISRITTATSAAVQSTQNTAVSETDIDDTLLTINVQTVAGSQTLSRQAVERGTGTEDVTLDDLMRRYATAVDSLLINQATTGLSAVAGSSITYTDTGPTAAELHPKLLGAASTAEAVLLGQAVPDYAVMHSRRWAWLQSQVGSTWPFINSVGIPPQAGGTSTDVGYDKGIRGTLPSGLRVVVDNNIPTTNGTGTNEDEIYIVASAECHLWEDPSAPMYIRAEQTNAKTLGIDLVVYGYLAYTFARYTGGQQKVSGTGLVAPSW